MAFIIRRTSITACLLLTCCQLLACGDPPSRFRDRPSGSENSGESTTFVILSPEQERQEQLQTTPLDPGTEFELGAGITLTVNEGWELVAYNSAGLVLLDSITGNPVALETTTHSLDYLVREMNRPITLSDGRQAELLEEPEVTEEVATAVHTLDNDIYMTVAAPVVGTGAVLVVRGKSEFSDFKQFTDRLSELLGSEEAEDQDEPEDQEE